MKHEGLSNEELASFRARVERANTDEASIVGHLVEIENRRLHLAGDGRLAPRAAIS